MHRVPLLAVVSLLACVTTDAAKACQGEDLPSDAQLRIGVTKRIPNEECTKKAKNGDKLSMHYTGTLFSDCSKFDSSVDRGQPFEFTLGKGEVIKGWDSGLRGMCIGEKRKLTIPSDLGYGDQGSGEKIPGKSTLVFEVELLDIKQAAKKKSKRKKKSSKKSAAAEM